MTSSFSLGTNPGNESFNLSKVDIYLTQVATTGDPVDHLVTATAR